MNDTRPHSPATASDDPRLALLRQWLERDLGFHGYGSAPASADASFRRYFRVTRAGQVALIVMDAPPDKEDVAPYLRVAAMLQDIGVHAPRILERSDETFHGVLAASKLDLERFPSAIEEGGAALLQRADELIQ